MEDIRNIYRIALAAVAAKSPAAPSLVNELAENIIDLPHGAAVTKLIFFPDAHALAKPSIERIATLNTKAKYWMGCNFTT